MKTSECRGCGAAIIWCRTGRGKNMPLDAEPSSAGMWVIEQEDSDKPTTHRLANYAASTYTGEKRQTHWETCPKASDFSRKPKHADTP